MHIYNHKKDSSRAEDKLFKHHFDMHPGALIHDARDWRSLDIPVFDQGQIGSCTANAGAGLWGYVEQLALGEKLSYVPPEVFPGGYKNVSRMMLYFLARVLAGDVDTDGGAELRNVTGVFSRWGLCTEDQWPYNISNLFVRPPVSACATAWHHRITKSYRITDGSLAEMKTCLLRGFPFIFGFTVYENFESRETATTGIVSMPSGQVLGGHAVEAIGFDDTKQWFIVRNSWGDKWGDRGYCYFPYAYLVDPSLASDFWTLRL